MITVVTTTVGNSAYRLEVLCRELRQFTKRQFRHIVCDDGTISDEHRYSQRCAVRSYGCDYYENPGPFGVSYNLNHAFSKVDTQWAFLIEDGLRPSMGWLETAYDFVERIGNHAWEGHKVGMAGFASFQDWVLSVAGVFPGLSPMTVWHQPRNKSYFYANWNDGYLCWNRMLPDLISRCHSEEAAQWYGEPMDFKRHCLQGEGTAWRRKEYWPSSRTASCGWYPGAFMLVNMDAWKNVGRFRDGCTFFEGHLGVRMGIHGYLSLLVNSPPFHHCPSQGFSASDEGKTPRLHKDTTEIFMQDFGYNHMDAPNVLSSGVVTLETQDKISKQLQEIKLWYEAGWEPWIK